MSVKEFKAPRDLADIQREYQGLAAKAGHLQYQLFVLAKDLDTVNESMRDLNFEAAAAQEAKKKAEAAAAAPSSQEPKGE